MYGESDETWTMLDPVHALHVSVSVVVLTHAEGQLQVLMQENHEGPYSGQFVLPNAILREDQTIEQIAGDLCESFGIAGIELEQVAASSYQRIDPRGRVMNLGFVGAAPRSAIEWLTARNDVALIDIEMEGDIALLSFGGMPVGTGFMHNEVVDDAVVKLRKGIDSSLMMFSFLDEYFTYAELLCAHEAILGKPITPQWFRKKMAKRVFEGEQMIVGTGTFRRDGEGKPAELFRLTYVDPAERAAKRRPAKIKKPRILGPVNWKSARGV